MHTTRTQYILLAVLLVLSFGTGLSRAGSAGEQSSKEKKVSSKALGSLLYHWHKSDDDAKSQLVGEHVLPDSHRHMLEKVAWSGAYERRFMVTRGNAVIRDSTHEIVVESNWMLKPQQLTRSSMKRVVVIQESFTVWSDQNTTPIVMKYDVGDITSQIILARETRQKKLLDTVSAYRGEQTDRKFILDVVQLLGSYWELGDYPAFWRNALKYRTAIERTGGMATDHIRHLLGFTEQHARGDEVGQLCLKYWNVTLEE